MPRIRFPEVLALGLTLGVPLLPARAATLDHAATLYLTHCGGCHGIEGRSGPTHIPVLRDEVGVFLRSPEGRAYIGRVPGVSMSLIRNDQDLADVLNFVIFRLGGASTPPGTSPFTAPEIHALRSTPLTTTDMTAYRAQLLQHSQERRNP